MNINLKSNGLAGLESEQFLHRSPMLSRMPGRACLFVKERFSNRGRFV